MPIRSRALGWIREVQRVDTVKITGKSGMRCVARPNPSRKEGIDQGGMGGGWKKHMYTNFCVDFKQGLQQDYL